VNDHLVPLAEGWALWRWCMVRGTGFPMTGVLALAAPATADAADFAISSEDDLALVRARTAATLRGVVMTSSGDERSGLVRALKAIERRKKIVALDRDEIRELQAAEQHYDHAVAAFERAAAIDGERIATELRRAATDPRLREAVTWQSRSALRDGIDRFVAGGEGNTSKHRRRERLIASYIQRYCTKNESIGFFGPFASGTIDSAGTTAITPGATLLSRRTVYFEHWAIDALAEALSADDAIKPFLAPRLMPLVAVDGVGLRFGAGRRATVPELVVRVLEACDGATSATAIAERFADELEPDELYETLQELVDKGYITWTLEVPSSVPRPEQTLAELLALISDRPIRERAQQALQRLIEARDVVAASAGDPNRIGSALDHIDQTFRELTGTSASRHAGKTYAGRMIVYEDTRRDLYARFGHSFVERLSPVLAMIGQSARWYTHEIATRLRAELARAYEGPSGFVEYWAKVGGLFPSDQSERSAIVADVATELSARWTTLLAIEPGERRVERTCAELAASVAEQFAAPSPGWPSARHIAPDLLVAARGSEAFGRGEFTPVIGEVHITNTMLSLYGLHEHPEAPTMLLANDEDIGTIRVAPVESRTMVGRGDLMSWSTRDLHLEMGSSRSWRPPNQVLRAADLWVEKRGVEVMIVERKTGRAFDAIAFFEQYLNLAAGGHFKPHPRGRHVPRITIGGVVVARERWELDPATFPIATERDEQMVATRRWARALGLPRHAFYKVPEETKPVYVDFTSPIYIELMASLVRKASALVVGEMLPSVGETWLPDSIGDTYSCELRLITVDPIMWRPPTPKQ